MSLTESQRERLAMYALDELEPAEHAGVEALIAVDPEAAALVTDLRLLARGLCEDAAGLRVPESTALPPDVRQALQSTPGPGPRLLRPVWWLLPVAAAAAIALAILFPREPIAPPAPPPVMAQAAPGSLAGYRRFLGDPEGLDALLLEEAAHVFTGHRHPAQPLR